MNDHETFLLLAAKQLSEQLSTDEEAALTAHLSGCPSCRATLVAMRRDDILLRGELGPASVSPRVRRRVLDEAAGVRRFDWRPILGLAAALIVAAIGVPLIAGGPSSEVPSQTPSPASIVPSPSVAQVSQPASASPSLSTSVPTPASASPAPSDGSYVTGAYVYGTGVPRRDTIAAHFEGTPVGEWSRTIPATGEGDFFGGPITCLVIQGNEAWIAGPATTATDGTRDGAVFIHVVDRGPEGAGDLAFLVQSTRAQTLTTMEEWCRRAFVPAAPYPLISGDITVFDGGG
jgi:Putative zinc-finger